MWCRFFTWIVWGRNECGASEYGASDVGGCHEGDPECEGGFRWDSFADRYEGSGGEDENGAMAYTRGERGGCICDGRGWSGYSGETDTCFLWPFCTGY